MPLHQLSLDFYSSKIFHLTLFLNGPFDQRLFSKWRQKCLLYLSSNPKAMQHQLRHAGCDDQKFLEKVVLG